jgi:branched-chain amino acid transport system permease protein
MSPKLLRLPRGPERGYYWFFLFLFFFGLLPLGVAAKIFSTFYLRFGTELLILGLFALSVDIIMGYTGLVSLGPAAFFGIGAYAGALTLLKLANSIWLGIAVVLILSWVVAWLIGYLSIRIRGVYFAMLTLAFAEMFHELAFNWQSFTGGSDGLTGVPRPEIGISPYVVSLGNPYVFFYFVFGVVIVVYYACVRLVNSPFGRVLQAICDNEERAEFIGYDVRIFKRRSFVISGIIGGLSGSLFALLRFVDPDVLHWFTSAEALVMTLFGGMGTLYGPVIGAIVFLFCKDLISSYTEHWRLILGVIFVGFVLYSPRGIVGLYDALRDEIIPAALSRIRLRVGRGGEGTTGCIMSDTHPGIDRESSPKSTGDLTTPGIGTDREGEE